MPRAATFSSGETGHSPMSRGGTALRGARLACGGPNGSVYALAVSGGTLYAGGLFSTAGTVGPSNRNIAQWDGTTWSAPGSGVNGTVSALAVIGGTLYAGGSFSNVAGGTGPLSTAYSCS